MKGATAEPWVSTSTAPNRPSTTKIGSSQNFLRVRMKRHSSFRKATRPLSSNCSHTSAAQQVGGAGAEATSPTLLWRRRRERCAGGGTLAPHQDRRLLVLGAVEVH